MKARLLAALTACAVVLLAACSAGGTAEARSTDSDTPGLSPAEAPPGSSAPPSSLYLSKVEGLHVTGTAVNVDVETFRLQVGGKVESPLDLSFAEIKALDSTRLEAELVCPGFFVDKGFWTGVPVRVLLERAGLQAGARRVSFTSVDGSYTQSLPLEKALDSRFLVSYAFDDREFPVVHGYPLRLVAPGEPGSIWVKWLGSITVE